MCRGEVELSKKRKMYYFVHRIPSHSSLYGSRLTFFFFFSTVIRFNKLFTEIRFDYEYTILIITKRFNPSTFYFMNLTAAAPDSRSERN